ncbi:MAG: ANTAR domain-containing protein, partial [Solirubrobacteraceae bacterium]
GPCIDAFERRELVSSDDLADEERWGEVPAEALEQGMRALLVSPIPYASDAVGVVAVFSSEPHAWTPEGELAVMAFTDLAALTITSTLRSEQRGETSEQLQRALDARVVIEQAKGVLVAQEGLTPRAAFERLRADARRSRRRLADLAAEVVRTASP